MAGDWIKMRGSLMTNPKVLWLASFIASDTEIGRHLANGFSGALREIVTSDVTRDVAMSSLFRVWCATNEHTCNGVWRKTALESIDRIAGVPGFGSAMVQVGWLIVEKNGDLTMPNFLEYNVPAKDGRGSAAARQARYRERQRDAKSDVTRDVTDTVTRDVTSDVEKRREELQPLPPTEVAPLPQKRGERLNASWKLPRAWGEWALRKRPEWDENTVRLVADQFRNHWVAKSGRDATKLDWELTWQNWVISPRSDEMTKRSKAATRSTGVQL